MRASARRDGPRTDSGFTLIEVLVAMVVFSLTAVFATTGWLHLQRRQELRSGVDEVTAVMRNAHELALSEAVTYCVAFDADNRTYVMKKFGCGSTGTTVVSTTKTPTDRITFGTVTFTQADGTVTRNAVFSPRGSATPGRVVLGREGSSRTLTINVEGLTGRVSVG